MSLRNFAFVRNIQDLSRELGCERAQLEEYISSRQREFYKEMRIPKKGRRRREFRTVYKPCRELAVLQKNIATLLQRNPLPEYVQGFVSDRSIYKNAKIHIGQKILLHADIHEFFESITLERVRDAFETCGSNREVATLLAKLCTLDGFLPQGSSASPVLANLVCRHLDTDINALAISYGCRYSRYADDITLSGDRVPPAESVENLLKRHAFELRPGSCRTQRRGHGQYVTGLSVEDAVPRIPRRMKRRLRLVLRLARSAMQHADLLLSETKIDGWLAFFHSVEPNLASKLSAEWDPIRARLNNRHTGSPDDPSEEVTEEEPSD
ncbi:reverse transcriptase family protein [Polyangium fumosum]|nr:reverse transcriptase family protein [Polyangium fumosum]